ncbi:MAG: hypothetical protein MK212_02315 [Saprospiraceae bacterium]|nr:hypothetical protein [Saprospiraceae bacterium]
MEHLDGIHYERFYRGLINNATLIEERIEGETEDGDVEIYYGFDDAEDEAEHDEATLAEYGEAYYFQEGKVYQCIIYFENAECTGVNLFDEDETKSFVQELLETAHGDEDALLESQSWAKAYL